MEKSFTFIIMGATGDLAKLKLIPAIYTLLKLNRVTHVSLIGVARSAVSIQSILDEAKKNIKDLDQNIWNKLCASSYYQKLDFNNPEDFKSLRDKLKEVETKNNLSHNRLFYLATLPEHFESATINLAKVGLVNSKDNKWSECSMKNLLVIIYLQPEK